MTNPEALIAEYSAMRQEIVQTMQKGLQFRVAGLPVASAFIVYGFQAQNSIAFIAAIVILIAALYYGAHCTSDIVSVATYLYAIVEPKIEGLQWETMVAESLKKRRGNHFLLKNTYPIYIFAHALLSISCVFFIWKFLQDYRVSNIVLYSCILFILGVCFVIVSAFALHVSSNKYRLDSVSQWKEIEKNLYSEVMVTSKD